MDSTHAITSFAKYRATVRSPTVSEPPLKLGPGIGIDQLFEEVEVEAGLLRDCEGRSDGRGRHRLTGPVGLCVHGVCEPCAGVIRCFEFTFRLYTKYE